jgi:Xaa-Pro aminopeptidase
VQIIITPQTSYTVAMVLTHYRCTVLPNFVEQMLSIKNDTEIEGLKRAYIRDGASFVRSFPCPKLPF